MGNDIVYVLLVKDYRHAIFYVYGVCRTLEGAKKLRAHLITNDAYLEPYIEIDEEPLVEKICECAEKEGLIPGAFFQRLLSSFVSSGTYKGASDVLYCNKHFDIKECRANKLLEFESAIRYLGLPTSISRVGFDFVERETVKDKSPCSIPIGLDYAIYADRADIDIEMVRQNLVNYLNARCMGRKAWDDPLVKLEFVVAMTEEVHDYLPDMENRYYAYKDGEDSGWRL